MAFTCKLTNNRFPHMKYFLTSTILLKVKEYNIFIASHNNKPKHTFTIKSKTNTQPRLGATLGSAE